MPGGMWNPQGLSAPGKKRNQNLHSKPPQQRNIVVQHYVRCIRNLPYAFYMAIALEFDDRDPGVWAQ